MTLHRQPAIATGEVDRMVKHRHLGLDGIGIFYREAGHWAECTIAEGEADE